MEDRSSWTAFQARGTVLLDVKVFDDEDEENWEEGRDEDDDWDEDEDDEFDDEDLEEEEWEEWDDDVSGLRPTCPAWD